MTTDGLSVDKRLPLPLPLAALTNAAAQHAPLLRAKLHAALRQSYGHAASVHLAAAASVALLLSVGLYFLSPIIESNDYHIYRQYLPWSDYLDWSHYDSFVVDHVVVFFAISLPIGWLFLVNMANSSLATRVDVALLLLRLACCATVCCSLTVILTEFLSRRVMIALITLAYGALGLVYSWSVPVWRWYMDEASAKGLVAFLPASLQTLLLRTSLVEWLTDTTFMDKMRPFLPFLLPLSTAERNRVLEQLPVETQIMMTRPGMVALLPPTVQKLLLPSPLDGEGERETMSSAMVSIDDSTAITTTTIPPSATAGFDFHHTDAATKLGSHTPDAVVGDIMSKRLVRGCMALVKAPSSSTLNRTMTASAAVFALQIYASKGSRRMLVSLVQFAVASSLVSVASFAFVIRVLQLLTSSSAQSASLLRYFRQYLLRSWVASGQIAAHPAPTDKTPLPPSTTVVKKVQTAATSVSAVVAVLYVLRRLRQ